MWKILTGKLSDIYKIMHCLRLCLLLKVCAVWLIGPVY